MASLPDQITTLLLSWSNGDKEALNQLIPLVSSELRRLARRYMAKERSGHTLQTSALINEAYLRLINQQNVEWKDRAHFFAVAAQIMRHILIDHARSYRYEKRGAGAQKIELNDAAVLGQQRAKELIALDDALTDLAAVDPRKSQMVELRFFGGLTIEEVAEVTNTSPATVKRELQAAKLWLRRMMTQSEVA
ncbi:MAG TPA: sigma-70 family RNA polymerase sigma factor [Pyrinomonadaceae bacterium]|nr:sigma-70 family RNA polymerase sigma factor [Pyrinomonadaceae bacterium]